jgi:enoyl-CoA hydratase/carnithine racemase
MTMSENYETLNVRQDGNIVTVALNRPESRNAINLRMVRDLSRLIDTVEDATDVAVLVVRGNPDVFTAGIDLRDFSVEKPPDHYGLQHWEKVCRQLEGLNKFTVAAVQGECTGGGVQLTLLCDARIADKRAVFQLNEVKLGFLPGMATYRLAKYVGVGRAKNLILTGRPIAAEEACAWGILDQVCEPAAFEETLRQTIAGLLPFHPEALEMSRRLIHESYAASYEDFLGHFLAAQHRCVNSEAFHRLIVQAAAKRTASPAGESKSR